MLDPALICTNNFYSCTTHMVDVLSFFFFLLKLKILDFRLFKNEVEEEDGEEEYDEDCR